MGIFDNIEKSLETAIESAFLGKTGEHEIQESDNPYKDALKIFNHDIGETEEKIYLEVLAGFDKGAVFEIFEGEYIIGRAEECDIPIGDPMVSRKHAIISFSGGKAGIRDLASRSGVEINGEKISRKDLEDGDIIKIGVTEFRLKKQDAR